MAHATAASLLDTILRVALAPGEQADNNRFSFEGLTVGPGAGGALAIRIRKLEAESFRLASGSLRLEVGRLVLNGVLALVRFEAGRPRVQRVEADSAGLSAVKIQAPVQLANGDGGAVTGTWRLEPLAGANGTIRAEIVDAHLLFDADVTVPIQAGQVDFRSATVEHVGPDSRMGVSRLGIYVDAPNGRSYLYQFASAVVAGVEYERRGNMLGPWVTSRGKLQLQPFGESLLARPAAGQAHGVSAQARQLFDRTAVAGELRLGDGQFGSPGARAELVGRAEGRNTVRIHSEAVGRGFTLAMQALSVRDAVLEMRGWQVRGGEVSGAVTLRALLEEAKLCLALEVDSLQVSGLQVGPRPAGPAH